MASFFEFTKVQAPDLEASASLYRGAQHSITEAGNALNRASTRINEANQAEDTRIRTNNTDQLVAQINQATTLGEVDELQKYVASDDFTQEYDSGFYIDAAKVNAALSSRPHNIEAEQQIKTNIQSRDESTSVGGFVSGISAAASKADLDILRKEYESRNYSAASMRKLTDAYSDRLADIEVKATRDFNQRTIREKQQKEQRLNAYEVDAMKSASKVISELAATDKISTLDLDTHSDRIAQELVTKYKGEVSYDEAKTRVSKQLGEWHSRFTKGGMETALSRLGKVSPHQRDTFIADSMILSGVVSSSKVEQELAGILTAKFPELTQVLGDTPLKGNEFNETVKEMKADSAVLTTLNPQLHTPTVLGMLSQYKDSGELKVHVNKLNAQLAAHTIVSDGIQRVKQRAAAVYDRKRAVFLQEYSDNISKTASVHAKLQAAQGAGDTAREVEFKDKLSQLTQEFTSLGIRQKELVEEPTTAFQLWKKSAEGTRDVKEYITKSMHNRNLGNPVERLTYTQEFISSAFDVPLKAQWDVPTLVQDYKLDEGVAKIAADVAVKLGAAQEKEKRTTKIEETRRKTSNYGGVGEGRD